MVQFVNGSATEDLVIPATDPNGGAADNPITIRTASGDTINVSLDSDLVVPLNVNNDALNNFVSAWLGADGKIYLLLAVEELTTEGPFDYAAAVANGAL